ncbi:MAG: hypothetical protein ACK4ND_08440 [Cytophagaceae bacterium]
MKLKGFKFFRVVVLFSIVINVSCLRKEKFNKVVVEDWETSLAVPIVNSRLTIKDIAYRIHDLDESVHEHSDGSFTFIYRDTVRFPNAEDFIEIPSLSFSTAFDLGPDQPLLLPAGQTATATYSEEYQLEFENGERIRQVNFKGGLLVVSLSSGYNHHTEVDITFPGLQKNGIPYSDKINLSPYGRATRGMNLDGYQLSMESGSRANVIAYTTEFKLTSSGNPIGPGGEIQFSFSMNEPKYSRLYGNFGQIDFDPMEGTVDIEVFEGTIDGHVFLEDPKIFLTTTNSFGVPSGFKLDNMVSEANEIHTNLTASFIPGPNQINYPVSEGQGKVYSHFNADKSNSNIRDIFVPAPMRLHYKAGFSIGSASGNDWFVKDNSHMELYVRAEVPLYGSLHLYALRDTVHDIELPARENAEYVKLKIKVDNGMPTKLGLQGYWLDAYNNVIEPLFIAPHDIILSGDINSEGELVNPAVQYTELEYDAGQYDKISRARKLVLTGNFQTGNGSQSVKFFSQNYVQIQISILAKARITIE